MADPRETHPFATVPGVLALVAWSLYVLSNILYWRSDVPPSALVAGGVGIAACVAAGVNFRYWRAGIMLAAAVYLVVYCVKIIRMTALTADASFGASLNLYYAMSWPVINGTFLEKGPLVGLSHVYLEYAMPILMVASIAATLIFNRRPRP